MRKYTALLLVFSCLPFFMMAQKSMVGTRQGASIWFAKYGIGQGSLKYAPGQHFTWDKEVFYRLPLAKKWMLEAGVSQFKFRNTRMAQDIITNESNTIVKTNLSLQYDVTYPLLGYVFHQMQNMKSYIGFNISPSVSFNKYQQEQIDGTYHQSKDATAYLMMGFSYTHIIPLSKRWSLTSVLSFNTNTFSKYKAVTGFNKPNKSIGWVTGVGYTL